MTAEEIRKQNQKLIQQQQAQNAAVRAAAQAPTQTAAQKALSAYSAPVATASPVGAVSPAKQSGGVANSKASSLPAQTPYQQAMSAYDSGYPAVNKLEPVNYDTVQYRGDVDGGFQEADDAFKQSWAQIQAAYNAGDEAMARELINQLQGGGNFMGWYDDNGVYNGFVRGFGGAGNGSYLSMIDGKMAQSGNVDTDWWLTPQGNIMSGKPGGALADTGNTWSYADQRVQNLAPTGANTNAPGAAGLTGKIYRPSSATDPAQFAQTTQKTTQTAQQTAPQTTPVPQTAERVTDTRQLSAPEAYDPESDSLWQQYLSDYQGEKAPEWDETFDYAQTPEYQRYLAEWDRAQAPEYEGSPYDAMRDEALERAKGPFSYDLELDPVWQSYRKQYTREGRRASEDMLGQMAAMTGGNVNTAAATAAQQAGNYYSAQMADKVPQLYQDAYQRYLNEYQKQLGLAGEYNQYGQQDYNRFRDRLGQWNTDRSFAYGAAQDAIGNRRTDYGQRYNQFQDALSQWNADRSFAYGAARDNQALGRQQVEDQYGRYRDAVGDQRYDQQWAQQLREYADAQGWKATEWQQYLREYGDQLDDARKKWVYQQEQDALDREWNEDERVYRRALDAWEMGNTDYDRQWKDAERRAQYGDYSGMRALLGDQFDAWLTDQQQPTYRYTDDGNSPPEEPPAEEPPASDDIGWKLQTQPDYLNFLNTVLNSESVGPDFDSRVSKLTKIMDENGKPLVSADDILMSRQMEIQDPNAASPTFLNVKHTTGQRMTKGFQQLWPQIRNAFDRGATEQQIASQIKAALQNHQIADYEVDIMLDQLGLAL